MFKKKKTVITSIDLGNSKISVMVAEMNDDEDDTISIIEHFEKPTQHSLERGIIKKPELLASILDDITETLEKKIKEYSYEELFKNMIFGVSAPAPLMKFLEGEGIVRSNEKNSIVTPEVMRNAVNNAGRGIPNDYEELVSINKTYKLNDNYIINPEGLSYSKLKAIIIQTIIDTNVYEDIRRLTSRYVYNEEDVSIIFNGNATIAGVEKNILDKTILVIDMGAELTDVAYYHLGSPVYYDVIPIGCEHLENDLQLGLDIMESKAKHILGDDKYWANYEDEYISIKDSNKTILKQIPLYSVELIIETRIKELCDFIKDTLQKNGLNYHDKNCQIRFTGGGAKYKFILGLLKENFDFANIAIGVPDITGATTGIEDPRYSTGYGLLLRKKDMVLEDRSKQQNILTTFINKLKDLFSSGDAGIKNSIG